MNDMEAAPYSPLCFAVGWPASMNMLLDAGADPSTAIHCAITYEDDLGLKALLNRDKCLFAPSMTSKGCHFFRIGRYSGSILSYALWHNRFRRNFNPKILPLIIDALAGSRRRFMALAKTHLRISKLRQLGWKDPNDEDVLLDSAATAVSRCLEDAGLKIPDVLRPGLMKTIYHDTWMTADSAEMLLSIGFREVDVLDRQGFTPLLLNCHSDGSSYFRERIKCLLWFLRQGAKKVIFPEAEGNNIIHVLAANLGHRWKLGSQCIYLPVELIPLLPQLLWKIFPLLPADTRDNCDCSCSNGGCTPLTALFKHLQLSNRTWRASDGPWTFSLWEDKKRLMEIWRSCYLPGGISQLDYANACRLEVFERLGMRHTCCKYTNCNTDNIASESSTMKYYLFPSIRTIDPSEIKEFHEEDDFLRQQLDVFMELYDDLYQRFHKNPDRLWEVWGDNLEEFVPVKTWIHGIGRSDARQEDDTLPIHKDELVSVLEKIEHGVVSTIQAPASRYPISWKRFDYTGTGDIAKELQPQIAKIWDTDTGTVRLLPTEIL